MAATVAPAIARESLDVSLVYVAPDRLRELNEAKVQELALSIRQHGLLNPIAVASDYTLIAGHHRLEAFKRLAQADPHFRFIPVHVVFRAIIG